MKGHIPNALRRTATLILLTAGVLIVTLQRPVESQIYQQSRPFTIGVTRQDASIAPLVLARDTLAKQLGARIVIINPGVGPDELRANQIDLLYTDGVSALEGLFRVKGDLAFIAGALPVATGDVLKSPTAGDPFSVARIREKGAITAILSYPTTRSNALLFERAVVKAIWRQKKITPAFADTFLWEFKPTIDQLRRGSIDLVYASPEYGALVRKEEAVPVDLDPATWRYQGVIIVARKAEADSNKKELAVFLGVFSDGIRQFNRSPEIANKVLGSLGLNPTVSNRVYERYKARRAFSELPLPDPQSIANLIKELSLAFPDETKGLNPSELIQDRLLKSLRIPPSSPPATNDDVRIVSVSPALGTRLRSGQQTLFEFRLHYNLESVEQAELVVSIAQLPKTTDECNSKAGELIAASGVAISRGQGDVLVQVTWLGGVSKGGALSTGYLAPSPSLWTTGRRNLIRSFGVFSDYCYLFGP